MWHRSVQPSFLQDRHPGAFRGPLGHATTHPEKKRIPALGERGMGSISRNDSQAYALGFISNPQITFLAGRDP